MRPKFSGGLLQGPQKGTAKEAPKRARSAQRAGTAENTPQNPVFGGVEILDGQVEPKTDISGVKLVAAPFSVDWISDEMRAKIASSGPIEVQDEKGQKILLQVANFAVDGAKNTLEDITSRATSGDEHAHGRARVGVMIPLTNGLPGGSGSASAAGNPGQLALPPTPNGPLALDPPPPSLAAGGVNTAGSSDGNGAGGQLVPPPPPPYGVVALPVAQSPSVTGGASAAGPLADCEADPGFGDPAADTRRQMEQALADTFMHSLGLHTELKATKTELNAQKDHTERAQNVANTVLAAAKETVNDMAG